MEKLGEDESASQLCAEDPEEKCLKVYRKAVTTLIHPFMLENGLVVDTEFLPELDLADVTEGDTK